jgi:hypothetical protein
MGADFSVSGTTQVCVINSQSRQFQRVQSVANDKNCTKSIRNECSGTALCLLTSAVL